MTTTSRLNFTKTALAALPPAAPGTRSTYFDSKTRGLMLLVTPAGKKTFYVRRKIQGCSERIHIGRFPEWSVEQARVRADEINARVGRGENPAQVRRAARAEMTLDDLFAEYIARNGPHLRRPDKPRDNYRLYLSHWGSRKLSAIKHHEVDSLHKALARSKSNVTANIALKLLHVMFNKAINEWRIWDGENPAHGIRKLREVSRDRFLLAAELPFFMLAVQHEANEDLRDLIQLALLTGARRADLLAMRWDQICNETLVWNIPETKNGTPQRLPLCPEATGILARRRRTQASPWVFPGIGVTGHIVEPKSGWQRVLERAQALRLLHVVAERRGWGDDEVRDRSERALASPVRSAVALRAELGQLGVDAEQFEIRNLRFHDLRRTLGSWQARTGASLTIIGKSLNHKSPASTAVYARLDVDPVRAAIDKATAAMWRAARIGG
jgi:integrase